MTRLAFVADVHADDYGSRIDAASGLNARFRDSLQVIEWIGVEARRQEAVALVSLGDYSEQKNPAPWRVAKIAQAFAAGPTRQVHIRGNHDSVRGGDSIVTLLGRTADWTGVPRPAVHLIDDVAICAIPYVDRSWARTQEGMEAVPDAEVFGYLAGQILTIAAGLFAQTQDLGAKASVLCLHQTIAGARMTESQTAFLGDQQIVVDGRALAAIGFEAVVAGHIHRHQLVVDGDCPVLYVGSPHRVDFGEEGEAKGFVVADVGPGRFDWQFVETSARRFVTLRAGTAYEKADLEGAIVRCLDVDPSEDVAAFRRTLEEAGAFEIAEIRHAPLADAAIAGGLAETLSAEEALSAYFADDPDAEALVDRGRGILQEVGA